MAAVCRLRFVRVVGRRPILVGTVSRVVTGTDLEGRRNWPAMYVTGAGVDE
jgi:hypothetical protein